MSNATKEELRELIEPRLPGLEKLLKEEQQSGNIQFEDMFFSKEYIAKMVALLKDALEDQKPDYKAIHDAISLEMIANSIFWCQVRLYARRLS